MTWGWLFLADLRNVIKLSTPVAVTLRREHPQMRLYQCVPASELSMRDDCTTADKKTLNPCKSVESVVYFQGRMLSPRLTE
jgi:hypothetical protein